MNNKRQNLIVALDVSSIVEAERLIDVLSPVVKLFKVGSQLFTSSGPDIVKSIHRRGAKVFLDLKFYDIPNTVSRSIRSAADLGIFMLTVHTLGSRQMLKEAVRCLANTNERPLLIGVTILTSFDEKTIREIGIERSLKEEVMALVVMAKEEGLDGVVCSGQDIGFIRQRFKKDFLIIVPGIRPMGSSRDDQRRIITPGEAVSEGADFIVVGRPIIQNPDPLKAAKKILAVIEKKC